MHPNETGWNYVDWIPLAQDTDLLLVLFNILVYLRVP